MSAVTDLMDEHIRYIGVGEDETAWWSCTCNEYDGPFGDRRAAAEAHDDHVIRATAAGGRS